jgi:hypothetical protein
MWLDHGVQMPVGTREALGYGYPRNRDKSEGALSMNTDKTGHVKGISKPKKAKVCVHQRMVEYHCNEKGQATGNVVCRECCAVIPNPAKALG